MPFADETSSDSEVDLTPTVINDSAEIELYNEDYDRDERPAHFLSCIHVVHKFCLAHQKADQKLAYGELVREFQPMPTSCLIWAQVADQREHYLGAKVQKDDLKDQVLRTESDHIA